VEDAIEDNVLELAPEDRLRVELAVALALNEPVDGLVEEAVKDKVLELAIEDRLKIELWEDDVRLENVEDEVYIAFENVTIVLLDERMLAVWSDKEAPGLPVIVEASLSVGVTGQIVVEISIIIVVT
jgi:hypothetical protein